VQKEFYFNKSFWFRKYPARSTSRELRHETFCGKRQLCGLSTDSTARSYIQCRGIAPFLYYLSCVYVAPKACNFGENYLTTKICLQKICKTATIKKCRIWGEIQWRKLCINRRGPWLWDRSKWTSEGRSFRNREIWCYVVYNKSDLNFQFGLKRNRAKRNRGKRSLL